MIQFNVYAVGWMNWKDRLILLCLKIELPLTSLISKGLSYTVYRHIIFLKSVLPTEGHKHELLWRPYSTNHCSYKRVSLCDSTGVCHLLLKIHFSSVSMEWDWGELTYSTCSPWGSYLQLAQMLVGQFLCLLMLCSF